MKIHYIIGIAVTTALLSACMNDYDEVAPDNATLITADTLPQPNTTIAKLRARYATVISGSNYEAIQEDLVVEGIVTGNDLSGNIYQQIYIQADNADGTGNATEPGISVGIKGYGALYAFFPVGQKVRINLRGLYIGGYGKLPKIGQPYINTNGALRMGPMTADYTRTHIQKIGTPHPERVNAKVLTAADVDRTASIDAVTPMLVVIKDCQIADAGEPFAHFEDYLDAKENYSVEHKIHMADGGQVTLYTSTSATFAGDTIPAGRVTIYGILSRYSSSYQLQLRSIDDIIPIK